MVWFILAGLFIFLGFAVHKLKWYFLISGFNTMSKERKANVDTKGLGRLMGLYMYFLSFLFVVMGSLQWMDKPAMSALIMIVFAIATVILIVKAQKFNGNLFDENGNWKKGASKQLKTPITILVITLIGVAILMYFSTQQSGIVASEDALEIGGMYGDVYEWAEIEQLTLIEELPEISMRTNGSAVGSHLKGHFKFKNGEKAKLFVDKNVPPFISFVVNDKKIILNLDTEDETAAFYKEMEEKVPQ
ncbi:DUF3784 domain-containing protein [Solibacillus sp. R5-41]|uniref:DUF3784 domain-containing protein n=1 Tax=Solibacillus sp. R5-41 TaxID=2048654 RepID=UPI0012FE0349|nr:DUF3784 domain-containing protein [Solibacillus sp. R5-41]